ncbi:hypothetical protein N6H14_20000 [Paenibacillus sp. CC-CFT747]|nr:hypothetical protein N6H14_20000 [Paenibacillus sp. CC-CFT747]
MEKAAEANVSFVMASYLRLTPDVKVWFFRNLEEKYPHLVPLYAELYQASAYLPRAYKEPKDALIRSLLKEYRLNDTDRDGRFLEA